jgi:hypothetical protein
MTPPRCFRITFDDGATLECAAFDSADDRARALSAVVIAAPSATHAPAPVPQDPPIERPRGPGRPSHDDQIAAAMRQVRRGRGTTASEYARELLKVLARQCGPDDLPKDRTVRDYISRSIGRNVGKKYGKNPGRDRIRSRRSRC